MSPRERFRLCSLTEAEADPVPTPAELEAIEITSAAFVAACDALHLKISDPAARFVAEKVIELAQRGIRDPDVLRTMLDADMPLDAALPLDVDTLRDS